VADSSPEGVTVCEKECEKETERVPTDAHDSNSLPSPPKKNWIDTAGHSDVLQDYESLVEFLIS